MITSSANVMFIYFKGVDDRISLNVSYFQSKGTDFTSLLNSITLYICMYPKHSKNQGQVGLNKYADPDRSTPNGEV